MRRDSLRDIWNRPTGFAYNRNFHIDDLKGFCRVCRCGDLCRGGYTWKRCSQGNPDAGDICCLYYQAMKHRRYDLLEDEPGEVERAYFERS